MSGLYLIGVVALWLWLWLSCRILRFGWFAITKTKEKILPRRLLVAVAIIAWFGLSFWYGGGRKYYYDWQVARMCAVDGGVKVHETVLLPEDKFDNSRMVSLHKRTNDENALVKNSNVRREITYYLRGKLNVYRLHTSVIRQSDGKILGESFFYKRTGGDMPGPWHGSTYMCPELSVANDVFRQVFIKE